MRSNVCSPACSAMTSPSSRPSRRMSASSSVIRTRWPFVRGVGHGTYSARLDRVASPPWKDAPVPDAAPEPNDRTSDEPERHPGHDPGIATLLAMPAHLQLRPRRRQPRTCAVVAVRSVPTDAHRPSLRTIDTGPRVGPNRRDGYVRNDQTISIARALTRCAGSAARCVVPRCPSFRPSATRVRPHSGSSRPTARSDRCSRCTRPGTRLRTAGRRSGGDVSTSHGAATGCCPPIPVRCGARRVG